MDPFTVLDYVKTSIEILMNMKYEQSREDALENKQKKNKKNDMDIDDSESVVSMDEPPQDYEKMLIKYEAEVRNHIKIEQ